MSTPRRPGERKMQSPGKQNTLRSSLPEGLFTPLPKATSARLDRTASCGTQKSCTSEPSQRRSRRASEASRSPLPSLPSGYHESFRPGSTGTTRRKLVPDSLMESARSGPGSWEPAWRVGRGTPVFQELKTCIIQSPLEGTISPLVLQGHHAAARSPLAVNKLTAHHTFKEKKASPTQAAAPVNPLLDIFKESWNNFELFAEFAELGQLQESHLLSSLGKRSTTMDFLELLELLKSLDILADREGFYDPQLTLSMTDVHNVFTAVNMRSYTQWWSSGGTQGDADRNELVFEEYQMLMLALGKMMGIELDEMVGASGQEVFKNAGIDELISSAKKRSLLNRPGAARHLERLRNQEDVHAGFISIEAANKACAAENFERARSLAYGAATAFVRHGRPDLLCEVRLLDSIITRRERSVSIHKKKIQTKVEAKLEETTQLALDLNVEKAAAILTSAGKMVDSAKLPMKGRLKKKFNAAGGALLCAEQAIEGDEKISQAWDFIQRDSLEEGGLFLEQAIECYGDIQIRTQQIKICREALAKKRKDESSIRAGGILLIDRARDDISNFRFDEAAKTLEEARKHFLQWTVPVGRNQSLVEALTFLIKSSWNNKELYDCFCSYDDKNLSGQGSRASLMDFTELLHLLRYFGILSDRKIDEEKPIQRLSSMEISRKMELADACTAEQIRAEQSCKLAKADVYEEFRAVNRKSMQDLLQGNIDADDDMSSLDFQEYQLLMLRLGKLLGLPLTDVGCSPLFLKDIREVEQMKETLLFVKREAMQGIVFAGEKILMAARNLMQEKSFQEARDEVQVAVVEFQKLDDEHMQRINMASCRRLGEQIDKEERKENTRRADATAMAEAAVTRAEQILADFDVMGARYDEHQFEVCDREAEAARKFFKSAQAFGKQQQHLIVDITQRAQRSRELIIKLRQAVGDGRDELDSAKMMIQHLMDTSSPPFDKVLAHLIDAKEFFVKAKVKDELIEVEETMVTLVDMAREWILSNVDSGWTQVGQAAETLEKTESSQLRDAPETESLFTAAFAQHEIATRWFHKAKMADCVIHHQRMANQPPQVDSKSKAFDPSSFQSLSRRAMDSDQDDDPYKDELVQNLKHRIVDKHEAWLAIRKRAVEDALKIVQECRDAIAAKAFNSSKELLKKAKQLLKGDQENIVNELQRAISTAEMNDKESTKTIREQGLAIMEVVREAVQDGNFELAFDSAEQAMELFDRARDTESMKEVTQTRAETLEKARCKVEESTRVARECMEAGWQALVQKQFEAARTSIQEAKDSISEARTQNALRVMATDSGVASDQKLLKEQMEELERRLGDHERQYGIILEHERYQASILREELAGRAARARATPLQRRRKEIVTMRSRFALAQKLCHGQEDAALKAMQPELEAMEDEVEGPRTERLAEAERLLEEAEEAAEEGKAKSAMANLSLALRLFLEARDFDGVNRTVEKRAQVMETATSEKQRLYEEAMDALEEARHELPTDAIAMAVQAAKMAKECQVDELLLGFMDPNSAEFHETLAGLEQIEAEANRLKEEAEQAIENGCRALLTQANGLLSDVKDHLREKRLVEARVGLSEVKDLLEEMTTLGGKCPDLIASDVHFVDAALRADEEQWQLDENLLRGVHSVPEPDGDAAVHVAASQEQAVPEPPSQPTATESGADSEEHNEVVAERAGAGDAPEVLLASKDAVHPSLLRSVVAGPGGLFEHGGDDGEVKSLLLHQLCKEGDLPVLERILRHSPSLEDADEEGWTALMHAVQTNHLQCTRTLIDAGADVNARDKAGRTVLMVSAGAARLGAGLDTVKMLLDSGAHVTSVDDQGENVLHYCARSGRDELIEEFLQCLGEESLAETLLTTAALPRMTSNRSIKAAGSSASGGGDESASSSARSTGHTNKMQQILNEADAHQDMWVDRNSTLLDGFGETRETPLTVAVKSGQIGSVKRLISWGADMRAKDRDGVGCLHRAAQRGDVAVLAVIVDKLGEVDGLTERGESALWFASAAGKLDAVAFLLERKADLNLQDKRGWTSLHAACWAEAGALQHSEEDVSQRIEVMRLLIEKGLDPFAGDKEGRDALDLAVRFGSQAALTGLMEILGEDVVTYVGDHLLHVACWAGQLEIANMLMEMGANPMALTDSGFSPFHAACAKNRVELVKRLAGPGGSELPSPGGSWDSPMQICVLSGSRQVLATMLELQPEWAWAADQNGWTALHVASLLADSDAAEAILQKAGSEKGDMQIYNEPVVELAMPSEGGSEEMGTLIAPARLFTAGDDAISIARKCLDLAKDGRAPLASPEAYTDLLTVLQKYIPERPVLRASSVPTRVPSQDSALEEMEGMRRTESWGGSGADSESVFCLTEGVVRQWFPLPFRPEQHGLWRSVTKSKANGGLMGSETQAEMEMLSEFDKMSGAISRAERAFVREERKKAVGLRALVLQAHARVRSGNDRDAYSLMVRAEALAGDREYERRVCLEHRASLRRTWLEGLGQRSKLLLDKGAVEDTRAVIEEARGKAGWDGGSADGGVVLLSVENRLIESEVEARLGEVVEEVVIGYCQERRASLETMLPSKLAAGAARTHTLKAALASGEAREDEVARVKAMVEEAWEGHRQGGEVLTPEQVEELQLLSERAQRLENWFTLQKSLAVAADCTSNVVSWFAIGLALRALREAEARYQVLSHQVERGYTPLDEGPEVDLTSTDKPEEASQQDPNLITSQALTVSFQDRVVSFQDRARSDGSSIPEPENESEQAPEAGADGEEEESSVIEEEVPEAVAEENTGSDSGADPLVENEASNSSADTSTEDVEEYEQLRLSAPQSPLAGIAEDGDADADDGGEAREVRRTSRPEVKSGEADTVKFWDKDSQTGGVRFEAGMLEIASEACVRAKARIETKRAELVRLELEVVMDDLVKEVEQRTVGDGLGELEAKFRDIMTRADASREASEYTRCLQQLEEWEAVMQTGLYPAQIRSIDEFVAMQDSVSLLLSTQLEAEERLTSAFALLEAHDLDGARQQYAEARRKFRDAREKRSEKREAFYAFETSATKEEVCGLVFEMVEAAIDEGEEALHAAARRALENEIAIARAEMEKGDWRAMQKHLEESEAAFVSAVGDRTESPVSPHSGDIEGLRAEAARLRRAEEVLDKAEAQRRAAEEALANGELDAARETAERGREATSGGDLDAELSVVWADSWKQILGRVDGAEVQAVLEHVVSEVERQREEEVAQRLHAIATSAVDRAQAEMAAMAEAAAQELAEGLVALQERVQLDVEQAQQDGGAPEDVGTLQEWLLGVSHCQTALEACVLAASVLGDGAARTMRDLLEQKQTALAEAKDALHAAETSRPALEQIALAWPVLVSPESMAELMSEVERAQALVQAELSEKAAAENKCEQGLRAAERAFENKEWQVGLDQIEASVALLGEISEKVAKDVAKQAATMRSKATKEQRIEVLEQEIAAATVEIPELLASKLFDRARGVADRVLEHKRELLKLRAA